jgi:tRNA (guanine37-N1)-methyltransferase
VGVPDVLLSGHHAEIAKWRRKVAEERTQARRPDLYERYVKRKP